MLEYYLEFIIIDVYSFMIDFQCTRYAFIYSLLLIASPSETAVATRFPYH